MNSWVGATGNDSDEPAQTDAEALLRNMDLLDALPSLWSDHEPQEITAGLLTVLVGALQLDGVYIRFDASDGGLGIEEWRPPGPSAPVELLHVLVVDHRPVAGIATWNIEGGATRASHVASFRLDLPWESALVLTSTTRHDFPTPTESHLLLSAVRHAAIAIHAARRLGRERNARIEAEKLLARQNEVLRSLLDDVGPSLRSLSRRVSDFTEQLPEFPEPARDARGWTASREPEWLTVASSAESPDDSSSEQVARSVSRRELEVLGLLARGLSNKEIARVMWLSDRTVERHITSLYRKIGVARRSEATAFALRHGVV